MKKSLFLLAVLVLLGACSYTSDYEKGVFNYEPVYCYQSIGEVQCYKTPNHPDEKRLVNYYGPAPSRYDKPDAPSRPKLAPPPPIDYFVIDAEPIPEPKQVKASSKLPWADRKASKKKASSGPADGGDYITNLRLYPGPAPELKTDMTFETKAPASPESPQKPEDESATVPGGTI